MSRIGRCAELGYMAVYNKKTTNKHTTGEPGLVDMVLALHAGSRGVDSHRRHMSERFFRSNRPGYPHPVSSELEKSGIRMAFGDCSVTERRRWRPAYQTGKTTCARKTLQTQRGRTHGAGCVRQWFHTTEPLGERRYENWNTHTHINTPHHESPKNQNRRTALGQPPMKLLGVGASTSLRSTNPRPLFCLGSSDT